MQLKTEAIKRLYRWDDGYWIAEVRNSADVRLLPDNQWLVWTRSDGQIPGRGVRLKEMAMESDSPLDVEDEELDMNGEKRERAAGPSTPRAASASSGSASDGTTADKAESEPASRHHRHSGAMLITEEQYNSIKINAIRLINRCTAREMLNRDESLALIDLVLRDNSYVLALYTNFKKDPETFVRYARRKVKSSSTNKEGGSTTSADHTADGEADTSQTESGGDREKSEVVNPMARPIVVKEDEQTTPLTRGSSPSAAAI